MSRIVALMGAECTGKSTLAEALAARLNAGLVTEYLREWCNLQGRTPQQHEQAGIAAEQARRIEAAAQRHALVFCDTTPLMTALFSEHYFGDSSLTADALAFQRRCDVTLLCAPDLPWQADSFMRDAPAVRARVDARLRESFVQNAIAWTDIRGDEQQRLAEALRALGLKS